MKIEEVKILDIKPYTNNPRNNDKSVEIVIASIREFGFKVPIIIDENGVIVAGHTRVRAAEILMMKTVPAIRVKDLTEDQIKAFRIMDNKSQDYSEWDMDLLSKEFKALMDTGFNMELTGFSEEDIDSELKLNEADDVNVLEDRDKVITVLPPEAPRLKERLEFKCKTIEDYQKIKKHFEKNKIILIDVLLEMAK